jgi:hypothetical protein
VLRAIIRTTQAAPCRGLGRAKETALAAADGEPVAQCTVRRQTDVERLRGVVRVGFVFDVFSRPIVGWRAQRTMDNALVPEASEKAPHTTGPRPRS